jgi:NAD(P)-dependent dehydrogenase (short-subunit alcohol dehydrogenase family)
MKISLESKVAIVTGAFSGIGLATTLQFMDAGARVVAVDVADVPSVLAGKSGDRLVIVRGDVGQEATAMEFTRVGLERFGKIDVLINNAGVSVIKPLHEHTPQDWDLVMNTNVKAIYWAARHVIPVMIRNGGGGVILNTGSISGEVGIATQGAYGPSKGAVHQMTRQMAVEYARYNIRVNAVACGTVDTPIVHRSARDSGDPDKYWKMLKDNHPIGRIATPDEVASFFVYMASDLASFFTGAVIMMDGGYTAK